MKYLLVEDNDGHAELVAQAFKRTATDAKLVRVKTGEEAVERLERIETAVSHQLYEDNEDLHVPDVILLDINLPGLDGHEVLKWLKSKRFLNRIPVVMLTTSDAERDMEKAYLGHANSYLVKPEDYSALKNLLQDMHHYWSNCNRHPGPIQDSIVPSVNG